MTVILEWFEYVLASQVGTLRHVESRRNGTYKPPYDPLPWASLVIDINAAGAEMAVAKLLRRYWYAGVNVGKACADVANLVEVRHTAALDGRLIVRKTDHDDRAFFLVRGSIPEFEIVGWMRGADAKQEKWLDNPHDRGEAYFVPDSELSKEFPKNA